MDRRVYWRGLSLVCCTLVGLILGAAALYRYPPAGNRSYIGSRGSRMRRPAPPPPDQPFRSDFDPITTPDQRVGMFEYVGSAAMFWLGPILWWTRNRPGMPRHRINPVLMDGSDAFFLFALIGSVTLAFLMTLIAINAILGGSEMIPS